MPGVAVRQQALHLFNFNPAPFHGRENARASVMNRREFFTWSYPLRTDMGEGTTLHEPTASDRSELFMLAMAQGSSLRDHDLHGLEADCLNLYFAAALAFSFNLSRFISHSFCFCSKATICSAISSGVELPLITFKKFNLYKRQALLIISPISIDPSIL